MSDYDDLPEIDLAEISMIQGSDREKRMEKMLEKLEQIERQMLHVRKEGDL